MRKIISNNYLDEIFCEESAIISEQVLNEGKIYDSLKWKIFRFSVRFLTEDSMDEFLQLYYEKTKNKQAMDNVPKMSKKEKIKKIKYVIDRIPVEDRRIVDRIKIPEDFLNRKSKVLKDDARERVITAYKISGIGTLSALSLIGISVLIGNLALFPLIFASAIIAAVGIQGNANYRYELAHRFRVESIEKVKAYFGIRRDRVSQDEIYDTLLPLIRRVGHHLNTDSVNAIFDILSDIEYDIDNGTFKTTSYIEDPDKLKQSVKKMITDPGEFSVKYDLHIARDAEPINGYITIYRNGQKVSFIVVCDVSHRYTPTIHATANNKVSGAAKRIFNDTEHISGVEYFRVDNNHVIQQIF